MTDNKKISNVDLFQRALKVSPGGVHSPVRSFKGLDLPPIFFKRGDGAYIYDENDKSYIDFCMSFGPLILGHKNKHVAEAIKEGLEKGWSFGTAERYSLELAEYILERNDNTNGRTEEEAGQAEAFCSPKD